LPTELEHPVVGPDHQLPAPSDTATAPPSHQRGWVRILMWVVLLGVFALGFWWVLRKHEDTAAKPAGGEAHLPGR